MENRESVPYVVHEGIMTRQERTIKRLWILCIILIFTLIGTNGAWIWYENQFEDTETIVTQDTPNGNNNFVGHDGDIINGSSDDQN